MASKLFKKCSNFQLFVLLCGLLVSEFSALWPLQHLHWLSKVWHIRNRINRFINLLLVSWDRASLHNPACLGTNCADKVNLELQETCLPLPFLLPLPVSLPQECRLKECSNNPGGIKFLPVHVDNQVSQHDLRKRSCVSRGAFLVPA